MATISNFETALHQAEKVAVVTVLHAHPEWTLGSLLAYLDDGGPRSVTLRELTLRELLDPPTVASLVVPDDGGPVVDVARLERAKRARGDVFEHLLIEVLVEVGRPVGASFLRARVGGPRWKLQAALRRLTEAGVVVRTGSTSATLYQHTGKP